MSALLWLNDVFFLLMILVPSNVWFYACLTFREGSYLQIFLIPSPLVGSFARPRSVQKKSAFVGHLSIDLIKHQMQREWV